MGLVDVIDVIGHPGRDAATREWRSKFLRAWLPAGVPGLAGTSFVTGSPSLRAEQPAQ
jgi:hypothetical protein